jgi:hypothetical protein
MRLLLLIALCGTPLLAQEPGREPIEWRIKNIAGVSVGEVRHLLEQLQSALHGQNKSALARLIDYPLTLQVAGEKDREIRNEREFLSNYSRIVTPKVADVIRKQRFEDLFANWQGVMLGHGEVWISGICLDSKCDRHITRVVAIGDLRSYDSKVTDR